MFRENIFIIKKFIAFHAKGTKKKEKKRDKRQ